MARISLMSLKRISAVIVGCLGMAMAGTILAFNAYSNALKKTFNFTQSQVELMSSMSNLGITLTFPAGVLYGRFGGRRTCLAALLFSCLGFTLLYTSCDSKEFYHDHPYLIDIYYFFVGLGAAFTYMPCLAASMDNVDPKHRGKIVGLLDACFSAGPALVALIYGVAFVNGHVHDEENQNLSGFYLMSLIAFAVISLLGVIFLNVYALEESDTDSLVSDKDKLVEKVKDVKGLKMLKNFDFHFVFWPLVMGSSLQLMYINNITTYLKSFHFEDKSTLFTVLNPVSATFSKLIAGFASDFLIKKVPRAGVLLFTTILQTIVLTVCVFNGNSYPVLLLAVFGVGIPNGATWCLSPTITSELFGMKYFGMNWGIMMIGAGVGGLIMQQMFGALYDTAIGIEGVTQCYGLHCFQWSYAIAAVMSLCSAIFYIGLIERRVAYRKLREEVMSQVQHVPSSDCN